MDGLKPLVIEHNALQSARANSKVKTLLDERLPLSELIGITGKIVACYPNGGRNAGDSYIGALAQALSCYPACIIRRAHRVPGGIPSECRMLPSVRTSQRSLPFVSSTSQRHTSETMVGSFAAI